MIEYGIGEATGRVSEPCRRNVLHQNCPNELTSLPLKSGAGDHKNL
jgi:hypothetical protein